MADFHSTIVVDYGFGSVKCGFTGDDLPRSIAFPSTADDNSLFLDNFEKNIENVLQIELKAESDKHPFLLTEVPLSPKPHKEQTAQLLFEKFHVPALSIQVPGILSLYSSGRLSGLVLDSGDRFTYTVAVYNGQGIADGVDRVEFGGRNLSKIFMKMINEREKKVLLSENQIDIIHNIKEKNCYIAFDYTKELITTVQSQNFDTTYQLPDGLQFTIGSERFRCPETYFSPKQFNIDMNGLDRMIFNSIACCDVDLQRILFSNIYLTGGSTMFSGFGERMQKEIMRLTKISTGSKVISPQERIFSAWLGGTLVASNSTFSQLCVTKKEFEEFGSTIIKEKFSLKKS
jgi:actin-related protein